MTHRITVKLDKINLSPDLLDSLSKEFYGENIVAAGEQETGEMTFEFKDSMHPLLETPISAEECAKAFANAIKSFQVE